MKTRIVSFCVTCFALLTVGLNYFTFVRQYIITKDNVNTKLYYPGFTCFDKHAGELREMLLRNPIDKDSIYLLTKENDNLESVERAVAQIVQWDCMPHALNLGSIENVNGSEWVVKPYTYYYEGNYTNKLLTTGYTMVDKTEWSELWMKYDNELNPYIPRGVFLVDLHDLPEVRWFNKNRLWTCINETLCVIIFSLMFVFLLLCNHRYLAYFLSIVFLMPLIALVLGLGNSINAIITTIMLFIVIFKGYKTDMKLHISCSVNLWLSLLLLSIVLPSTLTSTLLPSNGYGVYGGKAHLFFAMQQIPKEYFTVKGFSVLQPGYPLGFPMLIYYIYCIIGEPTEWFIKFISCLFYIGSFYMIISQVEKISIKLFVLSFFLSDVVVNLATMFYSECIILFMLLLAWRLLDRKCSLGWFILGLSAWIKIEAIFFVPILYIVKSIIDGNRVRLNKSMIYGVLPFVVWMIYSRCFGAKVYDYANLWEVDIAKLTQAFAMEAKLTVFKPWNYSWMYIIAPLLSIYCFINKSFLRCYYRYVISSLFVLVSFLIVFSYIFSLSRAVNFDWHLQCMARLLVVPSAFSLMLLVTSLSRNNLKRK